MNQHVRLLFLALLLAAALADRQTVAVPFDRYLPQGGRFGAAVFLTARYDAVSAPLGVSPTGQNAAGHLTLQIPEPFFIGTALNGANVRLGRAAVAAAHSGAAIVASRDTFEGDAGEVEVFSLDPTLFMVTRTVLQPLNASFAPQFGRAVAVSETGETVVVARVDELFVYESSLSEFSASFLAFERHIVADTTGEGFGTSLLVGPDGLDLLVGVPGASPPTVKVFSRGNRTDAFAEGAALDMPAVVDPLAGYGERLFADAQMLVVGIGAPEYSGHGAVFVATRASVNDTLAHSQRIEPGSLVAGDRFGAAQGFSGDGSRLFVGVAARDVVYEFELSGGTFAAGDVLTGTAGSEYGAAVALSANGTRALIGAPAAVFNGTADVGEAQFLERSGAVWTEAASLNGTELVGIRGKAFGTAMSATGDMAKMAVSAPDDGLDEGRVYVFERDGDAWRIAQEVVGIANATAFGSVVSLRRSDGRVLYVAVGDLSEVYGYAQANDDAPYEALGALSIPAAAAGGAFGASLSMAADGSALAVGAPGAASGSGAMVVYSLSAAGNATGSAVLTSLNATATSRLGGCVGVSGDGSRVMMAGLDDGSGDVLMAWFLREGGSYVEKGSYSRSGMGGIKASGVSCALAEDGRTALVTGSSNAALMVFNLTSGEMLEARSDVPINFGTIATVALSRNGSWAALGFPDADFNRVRQVGAAKAVYYAAPGFTLGQVIELDTEPYLSGAKSGTAVDVAADASLIAVSTLATSFVDDVEYSAGAVFVLPQPSRGLQEMSGAAPIGNVWSSIF